MPVEVEVYDFQSVEHIKLQIDGFTALVGRSNIGKSAIVRAIQCALTGAAGTDFVRHGVACERRLGKKKCKCFARVQIRTSFLELTWEKGDEVNRYIVLRTGEKETTIYDKVGRGTPDFLRPEFAPVKVGDSGTDLVQVSEQWSPIFLLNQSGSVVADVLSDVARLDQINRAIRLVEKDRRADTSTRKVREKDIEKLIKALGGYQGLDEVLSGVTQVESRLQAVQKAQNDFDLLEGFLYRVDNLVESLNTLQAAVTPVMPDGETLRATFGKVDRIRILYKGLSTKAQLVRRLRGVQDINLPDKTPLVAALSKAAQLESWIHRIRDVKVRAQRLKSSNTCKLPNNQALSESLDRYSRLQRLVDRQSRLEVALKQAEVLLSEAEAEEQAVTEEIRELGVCPTCSQDLREGYCLHLGGS